MTESVKRLRLSKSKVITVRDLLTQDDVAKIIADLARFAPDYRTIVAIAVTRDRQIEILSANCDSALAVYLMERGKLQILDADIEFGED